MKVITSSECSADDYLEQIFFFFIPPILDELLSLVVKYPLKRYLVRDLKSTQ